LDVTCELFVVAKRLFHWLGEQDNRRVSTGRLGRLRFAARDRTQAEDERPKTTSHACSSLTEREGFAIARFTEAIWWNTAHLRPHLYPRRFTGSPFMHIRYSSARSTARDTAWRCAGGGRDFPLLLSRQRVAIDRGGR